MTRHEDAVRLRRTVTAIPSRMVIAVSAAIFAVAAFSATWTVTVEQPATYAASDASIVTGTVKAN
ncbi:MAG: hypothetical protein ACRCTI_04515 [Beijerinckiaceae bacterium]